MQPSNVRLSISDAAFLKDPESSELGRKIVSESIHLIDELGFEDFTFKKLAQSIDTTEASVYRYFSNKHQLLVYLTMWYWTWQEYRNYISSINIESPEKRLEIAVRLLTEPIEQDSSFLFIDEIKLDRIILAEGAKSFLSKQVDEDNENGLFTPYKNLVDRIAGVIKEINPTYQYPNMLITTVIEGAHLQRYFAEHLPRLTNTVSNDLSEDNFYLQLVFNSIHNQAK